MADFVFDTKIPLWQKIQQQKTTKTNKQTPKPPSLWQKASSSKNKNKKRGGGILFASSLAKGSPQLVSRVIQAKYINYVQLKQTDNCTVF